MLTRLFRAPKGAFFLGIGLTAASADVVLPSLLSDHAVLQKSARASIWGRADPGERVTVSLAAAHGEAVTDAAGRWRAFLDLSNAGSGPFELVVEGRNRLVVRDVAVGEVWLASGQSNMAYTVGGTSEVAAALASPPDPWLRQFKVKATASPAPVADCEGVWVPAAPGTVASFSGTGYYFARELRKKLGVPVGLVNASWGESVAEAWTSAEALDADPELRRGRERATRQAVNFPGLQDEYVKSHYDWVRRHGREDRPFDAVMFAAPVVSSVDWTPLTLPGRLPGPGATWVRRTFAIAPAEAGKPLNLNLCIVSGFVTVYWNGREIARSTPETPGWDRLARVCVVPAAWVAAGEGTLAVRIANPHEPPRVTADPRWFRLGSQSLQGAWLARVEYSLPPLEAAARTGWPRTPERPKEQQVATWLYNGMIHPLLPLTLRGAIWYQGESNASRAAQYRTLFPLMIADWRKRWGIGDFPFYFCQLPNYGARRPAGAPSPWAELREAQTGALALPETAQAVLIDVGEEGEIHPRDKRTPGERLARIALARTYGADLPWSGPVFAGAEFGGGRAVVRFDHAQGGLFARGLPERYRPKSKEAATMPLLRNRPGSALEGFELCGAEGRWVFADARIEGDAVIVSVADVPRPVAVRYGWADNPLCNLESGAGLPAAPFRTDGQPLSTAAARY